jgi:peptidoglycan/LPS O-acetylase OafA/YrhL
MSFGKIAVDGFFLVSGYLIAKSWQQSASLRDYLTKRVLRIYPAWLVAFLLTMVVVGPLSGASMPTAGDIAINFARACLLLTPTLPGSFEGLPYTRLNGSAWTIVYEFRCYLLIAILGLCGLLRRRSLVLVLTVVLIVLHGLHIMPDSVPPAVKDLVGLPYQTVRLFAAFLTGALFYLYREGIPYRSDWALAAGVALTAAMFDARVAELGLFVLGGYIVFWFAFRTPPRVLSRLLRDDVSYGLYLYAWPIQNTIVYYHRSISPWLLLPVSLCAAAALGFVSWRLIEKPALALKPRSQLIIQS